MTKQEFIQELSASLLNEVDSQEYHNSIEYYSRYIDEEMKKGKTEEEVMRGLGSPRLIAKTIIDSQIGKEPRRGQSTFSDTSSYTSEYEDDRQGTIKKEMWNILWNGRQLKWYEKLGGIVCIILILCIILAILGVAVALLIKVVLPIVVILLIAKFLYELFRK